jgi:hypothetical protein
MPLKSLYTLVASVRKQTSTNKPNVNAAIAAFEPYFFNNMVLTLESYFVHRGKAIEKKDGNPLNEVRMLCNSMLNNSNVLSADRTVNYDPAKAVLNIGSAMKLS